MKCEKCNSEYEGKICPNCNGLTDTPQNNEPIKKTRKLLGFRTNKIWKKILSILYLIFCFIYLLSVIGTEKYVNITNYDFLISQICDSLIFVILVSPYIFLSNTKLRNILPLFKKHSIGTSVIGLIIVTIIIGVISGVIDAAHSEEFLNDRENHAYTETVTEATCEKAGEIKKFCEYCGISETESIPKLNHKKIEISKTEPSCENAGEIIEQCELCNKEFKESLKALGHKMEEVSRKEPTNNANGEVLEKCSICGKEKNTVLEKLKSENSKIKNSSSFKTESKKENNSETNSSKVSNSAMELTKYLGKTLQDMSKELNVDFVEIIDNNYFYASDDNATSFEIYTKKTGGIIAIKLLESGEKYTLSGLKSNTSTDNASKILKSKEFKSIGDNKWVSKSNKDIIMFVGENWVYEKDSPLISEEALKTKAEEEFVPLNSNSEGTAYIGNGQIIELYSTSFSKFAYDFSQLTSYQKSEAKNEITGKYVRLHGSVRSVSSDGKISVFCDDYSKKANMWISGTATGNVKLIIEQSNLLASINENDEVIIYAKINADTYDSFLGTDFFDLYDGVLYSIGSKKIDIPIIERNIEGIYRYVPNDYSAGHGFGEY